METIQFIGACIGYTVSAITLITIIAKPIRSKLIGWVKGVNSTDTTEETLQNIEKRLTKLLEEEQHTANKIEILLQEVYLCQN